VKKVNIFKMKKINNKISYNIKTSGGTDLVVWGCNLSSSVGLGLISKQARNMISLPPYQFSVVVGLLLSDAWFHFSSSRSKNAYLGFAQSYDHSKYILFIFSILSHYCSRYPVYRARERFGKTNYIIELSTRALPCFTELYSIFYVNKVKIIPQNIYNLLTPVALAHMIMEMELLRNMDYNFVLIHIQYKILYDWWMCL